MIQQKAVEKTQFYLLKASDYFNRTFDQPEINFKLRGRSAGCFKRFLFGKNRISYNLQLLEDNEADFLVRTVPHEVAHLVAFSEYGNKIKPHGQQWKSIMTLFDADSSRCHTYDLKKVRTRQYQYFDYSCGCQRYRLTSIRHNRSLAGNQYHCFHCHQPLLFQEHR